MSSLLMLIPVALMLGLLGLAAFLWALKSGQFDDLDGAAHRILFDDDDMMKPVQTDGSETPASPPGGTSRPAGSAGGPT